MATRTLVATGRMQPSLRREFRRIAPHLGIPMPNVRWRNPVSVFVLPMFILAESTTLALHVAWTFVIVAIPVLLLNARIAAYFQVSAFSVTWAEAVFVATLPVAMALVSITPVVGALVRSSGRFLLRSALARRTSALPDSPILFLRSFNDDQVTIPHSSGFVSRLFSGRLGVRRLDHALLEQFSSTRPLIAIGSPGERSLPFGAIRIYVNDDQWQGKVSTIAQRASLVVIVLSHSKGLQWEI